MRSSRSLDAVAVTFDDDHSVANAGLIQTATLAQNLGLKKPVRRLRRAGESGTLVEITKGYEGKRPRAWA